MKIIISAEPEDMADVLALIMDSRSMFESGPSRPGWGWHLRSRGGKTYFLREIKGGISASPENVRAAAAERRAGVEK